VGARKRGSNAQARLRAVALVVLAASLSESAQIQSSLVSTEKKYLAGTGKHAKTRAPFSQNV
jgi:hypothetical protein